MRAGKDVFAQRSQVTNYMGLEWMRRHLAKKGFLLNLFAGTNLEHIMKIIRLMRILPKNI